MLATSAIQKSLKRNTVAESVLAAVVVGIGRGIASVLPRGTLAGAAVADGSETLALVVLLLVVLAPAALLQIPWLRLRLLADSLLVASLVLAAVQFINPTSGGMLALQVVLVLLLAATAATTTFRQFRLVPAGARQPLVVQGSLLIALLVALVGSAMAPAFDNPFGQLTVVGFALLVLAGAASSLPPKHQSIISRGRALSVLPYLGTALAVCGVAARIATGHPVA